MGRIAFTNARLLDGDSRARSGQTVIVEGDRLVYVGDDADANLGPNDQQFALNDRTLMPGMFQSHWHGSYKGLDFKCLPVGLEQPPGYLMLLAATQARLALDCGFTSVIGAATGDALDAQLKMAIADGIVEGPRIFASGRWLITTGDSNDLPEYSWWGITSLGAQRICDGPDEFRKGARREILEGAEVIKIFNDSGHALLYGSHFLSMTADELAAAVEATHQRGKLIRSHVTGKKAILDCIDAGVDILDHVDQIDEECIERIVESGTFVCPSVYLLKAIIDTVSAQDDGTIDTPFFEIMQQDFDNMCRMLPLAAQSGAKFMIGDDWGTAMTPHGDYHKEMQLYVDCGVPELDVIRWATRHPAEAMNMGNELGTITTGKIADLLIVDGDPSEDISVLGDRDKLLAIMKEGEFHKNNLGLVDFTAP
jgi:imidazolonepropionase-like amidohydrolase